MKQLNNNVRNWLCYINNYISVVCPQPTDSLSNNWFSSDYLSFVFSIISAILIIFLLYCLYINNYLLIHVLIPNNNVFLLGNLKAYFIFTCVFFCLCIFCIVFACMLLQQLDRTSEFECLFVCAIYVLIVLCVVLLSIWCICMYYAYTYTIEIFILNWLNTLTGPAYCLYLFSLVAILICLRYVVHSYAIHKNIFFYLITIYELVLFNILLTQVLGILLFNNEFYVLLFSYCRSVHVCLVCTCIYIFYLINYAYKPVRFNFFSCWLFICLAGLGVGSGLGFSLLNSNYAIFLLSSNLFFQILLDYLNIVLCVYIILRLFCNNLNFDSKLLCSLILFFTYLLIFSICLFLGLFLATICMCMHGSTLSVLIYFWYLG